MRLPSLHDLIPAEHAEAAKRYFRRSVELTNGKIGTGFIGTPAILPALVKIGAADLAEKLFLQLDVPGWLYQVERGATTIWERWDAIRADGTIYDPDMNSYNHYAYGAVCQWLFEGVAGFRPDPEVPGFRRIVFEPTILPALGFVRASHDSRRRPRRGGLDGRGRRGRLHCPRAGGRRGAARPRARSCRPDGRRRAWSRDATEPRAALAPGATASRSGWPGAARRHRPSRVPTVTHDMAISSALTRLQDVNAGQPDRLRRQRRTQKRPRTQEETQ